MAQNTYAYHPIPSGDDEVGNVPSDPPRDKACGRTVHRVLLGILFLLLLSLSLLYVRETTLNKTSCLVVKSTTPYALEKLPSHYTLPSGDKIPSVGLGKYIE
jgi:hypothetical protein